MIKLFRTYSSFFLVILIKYTFLLVYVDCEVITWRDFKEDIIFFVIILSLLVSYLGKNLFFKYSLIIIYLLYFLLETCSYLAVSSNFTSSFMYVLIETTDGELKEFANSYFNFKTILLITLMILLFFLLKRKVYNNKKMKLYYSIFITIFLIFLLKITGLIESNAYHNVVRGIYGYYELQHNYEVSSSLVNNEDVKLTSNNDVLVVVLGESTSSRHMQLYGYNRKTTPLLSSIKDSLYVYNDVISTDVITTKALPLILTSSHKEEKNTSSFNIIDIYNKAGFKTYWLSNQRPIGYYDNIISKIASSSNYVKFLNHRDEVRTTSYDEVLIPELNLVLREEGKKIIFIRLIGTHFKYKNRYPKEYYKFKNNTKKSEKTDITNHYDNAILYNDFVVYSILKGLIKTKAKSALLYLSDHGENVYDDNSSFFGRTEGNLIESMFEIPFLLWTSKDFEYPKDFVYKPNRKFMSDYTFESLGHIFGVKHKDMDFTRSIFSNLYKERKRIIVDGIDYDKEFLIKNE